MKKGLLPKARENLVPRPPERLVREEQKILRPKGPRNLSRHKYTSEKIVLTEEIQDNPKEADSGLEERKQTEIRDNKALQAEIEKLKLKINSQSHVIFT